MTDTANSVIDVEAHCAPTSVAQLKPYLSRYWNDYFTGAEYDLRPSLTGAYPASSAITAGSGAAEIGAAPPSRVDLLRKQLLDQYSDSDLVFLHCLTSFAVARNPYCEAAVTRAINDWISNEWLDQDSRLRASIAVPILDVDAAVKEIERIGGDDRFVQILLPLRSVDGRYGNIRFRRIIEAAVEYDLVVGLHAWGRGGGAPTPTGSTDTYFEDYLSDSQIFAREQLASLITEGCFDQFPDLRVVLLECGFSWIPAMLWRLEKDWKALWREVPWMKRRPSEYVQESVRASIQPAHLPRERDQIRQVLEMVNAEEFLMFASDFPHDHGDGAERLMRVVDDRARPSIMGDNARSFYRIG